MRLLAARSVPSRFRCEGETRRLIAVRPAFREFLACPLDDARATARRNPAVMLRPAGEPAGCGSGPAGRSENGLPLGLQLIGKAFDEATLLRAAHAVETAADFKHSPAKWWSV